MIDFIFIKNIKTLRTILIEPVFSAWFDFGLKCLRRLAWLFGNEINVNDTNDLLKIYVLIVRFCK